MQDGQAGVIFVTILSQPLITCIKRTTSDFYIQPIPIASCSFLHIGEASRLSISKKTVRIWEVLYIIGACCQLSELMWIVMLPKYYHGSTYTAVLLRREKKKTLQDDCNAWREWRVWKIPLEDIPWTCQHIMDQPIYASLFSFRWKSSTQTTDTQRPPSGFQPAPIACLVSAY